MATAHIHAFLGFTSTRLGSEVSCPRTLPRKNPEDPVQLKPRTPGLLVKHFTTEPRGTLSFEPNLAKPYSSVGSIADLRTGCCWFDPRLGQYSFRGLMIVTSTEFIPLSPLSVVLTMVMWESRQWLGKNIGQSIDEKNSRKHGYVHWPP